MTFRQTPGGRIEILENFEARAARVTSEEATRVSNSDGALNRFLNERASLGKHASQDGTHGGSYGEVELCLPETHATVSPSKKIETLGRGGSHCLFSTLSVIAKNVRCASPYSRV